MTTAIHFQNVTKTYPDGTVAIDDLTLSIPSGETTMLVGPSGCGKTTTLRMINRMVEPTTGEITLYGQNTADIPKTKLRRSIGYVIQDAGLFPHRTVLQNIMTVPLLNGVSKPEARTKVLEMMELVGLPESMAKRYPNQLSGGQQQRVGVARALAGDPRLILMDEPFSALDPIVRAELQDEFRALVKRTGVTIVFVTHDIDEAIKLGDQIALFEQGGVVAQFATPQELLRHPANEHVANFVGRDRGFRALSFASLNLDEDEPDLMPCEPVVLGSAQATESRAPAAASAVQAPAALPASGWCVAVDEDGTFLGWSNNPAAVAEGDADAVRTGVGVIRPDFTLRDALDSVLSSPEGRAVALSEDNKPQGLVSLDHLIRAGLLEQDGGATAETLGT